MSEFDRDIFMARAIQNSTVNQHGVHTVTAEMLGMGKVTWKGKTSDKLTPAEVEELLNDHHYYYDKYNEMRLSLAVDPPKPKKNEGSALRGLIFVCFSIFMVVSAVMIPITISFYIISTHQPSSPMPSSPQSSSSTLRSSDTP